MGDKVEITSGPIVACDNAIDHYRKEIESCQNRISNAKSHVRREESMLTILQSSLSDWEKAKEKLTQ